MNIHHKDEVPLEPAVYHDVPTNTTEPSEPSASAFLKNSAAAAAPPSRPPPSTVEHSYSSSLHLVSMYLVYVWQALNDFLQNLSDGNLFSSISGSESLPSTTNKGQRQCETYKSTEREEVDRLGVTLVLVSDTHGQHDKLTMPEVPSTESIFISAGDWTRYGKKEDAISFNEWLGKLPYQTKIVVNGNHECNAMWKRSAKTLLSNATLLVDEFIEIELGQCKSEDEHEHEHVEVQERDGESVDAAGGGGDQLSSAKNREKKKLKIYGTNFYWPCSQESNPYFDQIDSSVDILISHCPALGYVDNDRGCPALLNIIQKQVHPKLVISGHEHNARGIHFDQKSGITFVNAANAKGGIKNGHACGKQPMIITL